MAVSTHTDEDIQRDVLEELTWDIRVSSYAEKKAAEETVYSASGVTEVDNRIIVSLPV